MAAKVWKTLAFVWVRIPAVLACACVVAINLPTIIIGCILFSINVVFVYVIMAIFAHF